MSYWTGWSLFWSGGFIAAVLVCVIAGDDVWLNDMIGSFAL